MGGADTAGGGWRTAVVTLLHPRVVTMLFLGFAAGLPLLLIFSSLSLWLREAGVERAAVTFFSWAALGYSFKWVWAPLIDRLPVPGLTRWLGRRRAWLLVAQGLIIVALLSMAWTDPARSAASLILMALAAVLLGFASATQDIVIDAYRIEAAESKLQAMMSATYIAGYRLGMLVAGAGALFLAGAFGTAMGQYHYPAWRWTYTIMAAAMLIGVATTLLVPEPARRQGGEAVHATREYMRFVLLFVLAVSAFIGVFVASAAVVEPVRQAWSSSSGQAHVVGFVVEMLRLGAAVFAAGMVAWVAIAAGVVERAMVQTAYVDPVREFFCRYGRQTAWLVLALVGVYRISDIVLGVIANVFYQDLGFSKAEIATIVKTFGLFMTITGGFLGGVLAVQSGVMRILWLGAWLSAATNLLFMGLAYMGHAPLMLAVVISADNLSAGLASAAFVAFLSSLTSVAFTAVQYAIFSSLMTLIPKLLGGYAGSMVEAMGYTRFFVFTTLLGVPVLLLVWWASRHLTVHTDGTATSI
jgi:PAT family beta-lactamase induction signal transducer AmpG